MKLAGMHALKRFLIHNWFLKLFSLVLATMAWLTIASETSSEIRLSVPLEFRNIPPNVEMTGETTDLVEVRMRGPSNLIREVSEKDISASIVLSQMTAGEKAFSLTSQNIRAPFGIEIVRVSPTRVSVNLERTMSKTVPVIPRFEGELGEGYEIEQTAVLPDRVQVRGPESRIRSLESVFTAPVSIAGLAADILETVDLDITDPLLRLQYALPVEVGVTVREQRIERTMTAARDPNLDAQQWSIEPPTVQVTVKGPRSAVMNLEPGNVYFTIPTDAIPAGRHELVPAVMGLEGGIEVSLLRPQTITVVRRPSDESSL